MYSQQQELIEQELEIAYQYDSSFAPRIIAAIDNNTLFSDSYAELLDGRACGCFYGHYFHLDEVQSLLVERWESRDNPGVFRQAEDRVYKSLHDIRRAASSRAMVVSMSTFSEVTSMYTPIEMYLIDISERTDDKDAHRYDELRALLVPYAQRYQSSLVAQPE